MKVYAFLPAKGSSQRIPNKNVTLLDGEPLFLKSLKKLCKIAEIDRVILDTEDEHISGLASEVTCEVLHRENELASNETDGNSLMANEASLYPDADIYVQLLGTSPFIKEETIIKGINILKQNPDYDSVVAVRKEKQYLWKDGKPLYDWDRIPNSVDLPDTISESMGLYIVRRDVALVDKKRLGARPYLLELDVLESFDVNWPEDFEAANIIAVGIRERERRLFNNLKFLLSSSILSDVLDEIGVPGVLSSKFQLNLTGAKILGRAKTMQIKECAEGDDYRKIYESMSLYDSVVSNDIVIVANDVPEFAFFGELNANLAIRAGATGAIIDGVTRDSNETKGLNFPVFSKGTYCKDTRGRGIISSLNKSVIVDNVRISKDDLIFGDNDGIVVISREDEDRVLELALEKISSEKGILISIAQGEIPEGLVKKFGYF